MTLPITERIIQAVVTQLGTITTAAGYNLNAPKVMRSRTKINPDELPALVVWAPSERATGGQEGFSMQVELQIEIDAAVAANDTNTGTQLELAKSDVKRALGGFALASALNDSAIKPGPLLFVSAQAQPRPEGLDSEVVTVTYTVSFREKIGDPTKST